MRSVFRRCCPAATNVGGFFSRRNVARAKPLASVDEAVAVPRLLLSCLHCDAPPMDPPSAAEHHESHLRASSLTFTGAASFARVVPMLPRDSDAYVLVDVANLLDSPTFLTDAAAQAQLVHTMATRAVCVCCVQEGEGYIGCAPAMDVLHRCVHRSHHLRDTHRPRAQQQRSHAAKEGEEAARSSFHHVRVDGQRESGDLAIASIAQFLLRMRKDCDGTIVVASRDGGLCSSLVSLYGGHRLRMMVTGAGQNVLRTIVFSLEQSVVASDFDQLSLPSSPTTHSF